MFYVLEVDAFILPPTAPYVVFPYGTPRGYGTRLPIASSAPNYTIRASDVGYRTEPTYAGGVVAYPPMLGDAFALNRQVNLDPTASGTAAAWGTLTLLNGTGAWNYIAAQANADGRGLRIKAGAKVRDTVRGLDLDPQYASLQTVFNGLATPWLLDEAALSIPLQDAAYWLSKPLQTQVYTGTGGLLGGVNLVGQSLPKTRGVCLNVTPVLVDPVNQIYQYSDAHGTVQAVSEGGANTTITYSGDVADLTVGSATAGTYRTNNANGLFQLGSTPSRTITADVTGAFPIHGFASNVASLLVFMLWDDLQIPPSYVDISNFTLALLPQGQMAGGVFFSGNAITGQQAVDAILPGCGLKLITTRAGALKLLNLVPAAGTPALSLDPTTVVSLAALALPVNVSPPAYRFRVGYGRNWTTMSTDIAPSVSVIRKAFLLVQDAYSAWMSTVILTTYKRANDVAPVGGVLASASDAQKVANYLGNMWGVRRRLYGVTVPVAVGLTVDFGSVVSVTWPLDDLQAGKLGVVVGEQYRAGDGTTTLMVLV